MIVSNDTTGRNYDWLLNSEPALEIIKAKGAQAAATAVHRKAKTPAVRSAAQQAKPNVQPAKARAPADPHAAADAHQASKPIMVDHAAQAVAGPVGRQLGNRLIGGVPGGFDDGR
ncbi:MAG: hypothetical protein M3N02_04490 [Pseudomonadota bacterium]|nr:hypothetical protein [Pseudomonadota bacterium]